MGVTDGVLLLWYDDSAYCNVEPVVAACKHSFSYVGDVSTRRRFLLFPTLRNLSFQGSIN